MIWVIALVVYLLVLILVLALCKMAARGDRQTIIYDEDDLLS